MKHIKLIILISVIFIHSQSIGMPKAMGQVAVETAVEGVDKLVKDHLPAAAAALAAAGTQFGRNIGVGALETIGEGQNKLQLQQKQ